MGPEQLHAQAMQRKMDAQQAAERRQRLALAMAHVLGTEGQRNEDQRLVWSWLTREQTCILERPDATALAVFEGRRQKGAEASVYVAEATKPTG
jgi:hypothetical protein